MEDGSLRGESQELQCRVSVCPCTRAPPQVVCLGGADMSSRFTTYNPHHGGIPPAASLRARDPSDGWGGGAGRTGLGLEPAGTPH